MTHGRFPSGASRSNRQSWTSPEEDEEMERRRPLFRRAKVGDENALADLRDGYGMRTLVLDGVTLIREGVLIGTRVQS